MAGHYYDSEGNERHDADMRTVKKEGLLISVTTFLDVIRKPGLDKWKIDERLKHAYRLMKDNPDLPFCDFRTLVEDNFQEENNAADLGTLIHEIMEGFVVDGIGPSASRDYFYAHADVRIHGFWQSVNLAHKWLLSVTDGLGTAEHIIVNEDDRYAGKIDYTGMILTEDKKKYLPGIIDWKSQNIKKPGGRKDGKGLLAPKIRKDQEWLLQMGAYAKKEKALHGYIGVISTNPMFPFFKPFYYNTQDVLNGYKTFRYAQEVFKYMKGM